MADDRIVVLDGYTLNPGDLDWTPLATCGALTVHQRTDAEQLIERAREATILLTNKVPLSGITLAQLPKLRYIGVLATGVNVIDLPAARQAKITVTNVPGYSTDSVAQLVFALLGELTFHTSEHVAAVRAGRWTSSPDFSFTLAPLMELTGKTMGIIGLGTIGQRVARIAAALGMKIAAAHQRSMHQVQLPGIDLAWYPLEQLLPKVDVLTLHCPLTAQTQQLINRERLELMKPSAILINTGRGPLLDEAAVAQALQQGRLAAAAVDVLSSEPPPASHPLLHAPRCLVTPHLAWATLESRTRLMNQVIANVRAFQAGQPIHVVS